MPQTQTLPRTLLIVRRDWRFAKLASSLLAALARRRDRALLARLDSHLLRDIGLEPEIAAKECAKPFWQP